PPSLPQCYAHHRRLPSFPTRRSSDLVLRKKGCWAVVVIAMAKRDVGTDPWSDPVWILSKWRKMRGRWHNWTEFRVADDNLFLQLDRKSTRLNSSHVKISYAVFCLKKK